MGLALAEAYLGRNNVTLIGTVRSVSSADKLKGLKAGSGSKLIVLELDARDEAAPLQVAEQIKAHGIDHLDLVIANAGMANDFKPVAKVPMYTLREHVEINGYAPIALFQAILPLLQKGHNPKFVSLGSPMGSIAGMETRPFPMTAYGVSKAVLHYLMRKIHLEHPDITAFPVDPG